MAEASLAERFRRHADSIVGAGRSPLYAHLMQGGAEDIERDGLVARIFADHPNPPGSVPTLRLLAALHHLVLSGRAPALAAFYPSAGGMAAPQEAWDAALGTIEDHEAWVRERIHRPVQTNEPGRAVVLYAALLWLASQRSGSYRLLEIGASAGLNLLVDRFSYRARGHSLGDAASAVHFNEPWSAPPEIDLRDAARSLRITRREGCDPSPLDPTHPEDCLDVLSYVWPDEVDRLERTRAALMMASSEPPTVVARPAEEWLTDALSGEGGEDLTVIWQSIVRQYVHDDVWGEIEASYALALRTRPERPVVWLRMEPGGDHLDSYLLTMKSEPDRPERLLAVCGNHGPPVRWQAT